MRTKQKLKVRKDYIMPDALWEEIEPLIPKPRDKHPLGCHRRRVPDRDAMNAIFFVLKTGCQWNALNKTGICSSSASHRRFQEWQKKGVMKTPRSKLRGIRRAAADFYEVVDILSPSLVLWRIGKPHTRYAHIMTLTDVDTHLSILYRSRAAGNEP